MNSTRRRFIRSSSTIGAGTLLALSARTVAAGPPDVSIEFDNQFSDGTSITISWIRAREDVFIFVRDENDAISDRIDLTEGDELSDQEITLNRQLEGSETIRVHAYPADGGEGTSESARIQVVDDPEQWNEGLEPMLVEANPEAGFHYPYYLYAPMVNEEITPLPILVQPNNTGEVSDDLAVHRERAEADISGGFSREISDDLGAPFLVPVFPRPEEEPVDWSHYIHALDNTSLSIEAGPLERVDLQLLAMVEDAQERLLGKGIPVDSDGMLLNGFSASGNFVERFVTLHPDRVVAATAGGLNGMVTLPIAELGDQSLPYHIGVGDFEALVGEEFDRDTYRRVPQFLYLGEDDDNDTIPFDDAWTGDEFRKFALDIYGEHMQNDRFPLCKAVHAEQETSAVFRMYKDTGHTPRPATDDLLEFYERVLAGDDIEAIRADLGGNVPNLAAYIENVPSDPTVGDEVVFDAGKSRVWDGEISDYQWRINGESAGSGEIFSFIPEESGGYVVEVETTTTTGATHTADVELAVSQRESAEEVEALEEAKEEAINDRDETIDELTEEKDTVMSEKAALERESGAEISSLEDNISALESANADDKLPGFGLLAGLGGILGGLVVIDRMWNTAEEEEAQ